jgi:hypothetical protein
MRHFVSSVVALVLSFGAVAAADASSTPVVDIQGLPGSVFNTNGFTVGWEFTTASPLTVTDLGVFDADPSGLPVPETVKIWNFTGSLIASATVPSGTGAPLVAGFRYASISPTVLAAGHSFVIGVFYSDIDGVFRPTGFPTVDPRISLGLGRSIFGDSFPTTASSQVDFGPNFQVAPIPEPTTLLLFGTGLVGVGAGTRRRRRKEA